MIFTKYLNDFWHKRKMYNFEPYCVLLVIATNIPVLLKTAFMLQGHKYHEKWSSVRVELFPQFSDRWRTEALNQFVLHGIRYAAILAHFESD